MASNSSLPLIHIESRPDGLRLANQRLEFFAPREDGTWQGFEVRLEHDDVPLAACMPFASVAFRIDDDLCEHDFTASDCSPSERGVDTAVITFTDEWTDPGDGVWTFSAEFSLRADATMLHVMYSLTCSRKRDLLLFRGPFMRTNIERQQALFPGLDWLLPGEASSSTENARPPHHLRYVPHPYRITVPAMCIAGADEQVALLWNPRQRWDGVHECPGAVFASPDNFTRQPGGLMGLFAPSVGEWITENTLDASQPYDLPPGKALRIECHILTERSGDPLQSVRRWCEHADLPALPVPKLDLAKDVSFLVDTFTQRAWDESSATWSHECTREPRWLFYDDRVAAALWRTTLAARASDRDPLREQVLKAVHAHHDKVGIDMTFHVGGIEERLLDTEQAVRRSIVAQKADGSWPFEPAEGQLIFGERGDSSSGLTGQRLCALTSYALLSADNSVGDAIRRGLAYLKKQQRPEGAQTWELPLHVPDVLAAPHAIMALLDSHQLNESTDDLEQARRWAYTGLPFIYLWEADDRPIMAYGSVPVFGVTNLDSTPWFGLVVQWCGLEYARALFRLAPLDSSFDWRRIAEGITRCGLSQLKRAKPLRALAERLPACEHLGYYPDAYSVVTGTEAYHWCINPRFVLENALRLVDKEPAPRTTIVRSPARRVHVTTMAALDDCQLDAGTLAFDVIYHKGEVLRILVAGIDEPARVVVNGVNLKRRSEIERFVAAWTYDAERHRLIIKAQPPRAKSRVEILNTATS